MNVAAKLAAPLLAAALLGSGLFGAGHAQTELRVPPDPLIILGVAQDSAGSAGQIGTGPVGMGPVGTGTASRGATAPSTANPGAVNPGLIALRGRYSAHVRVVDAATAALVREYWLPPEVSPGVTPSLSADGRRLAVFMTPDPSTKTPRLGLLNVAEPSRPEAPAPLATVLLSGGLAGTASLSLNADGTRLAAGNRNGYVQLWDVLGATRLTTIQSDTKLEPASLQFSPDGTLFAPIFRGQTRTRIFDAKTGQLRVTLSGVGVGQFAPDSKGFLASRGRLIDLGTGKELPQPAYLKGTGGVIGASADGTRILVRRAATDAQGREWLELREVATGRVLGTVTRISDGWPEYLSPDGTSLIGGDGQGGVRMLPIAPR